MQLASCAILTWERWCRPPTSAHSQINSPFTFRRVAFS